MSLWPLVMRGAALIGSSLLLASCGQPSTTAPTFHRDVQPIIQQRCQGCHASGAIGPFALETYAQVKEHAAGIAAAVQSGRMPPWLPAEGCGQPFVDDPHLSTEQIATLTRWAEAPVEGNPADAPPVGTGQSGLERVDLTIQMPQPYTPPASRSDDYRCFPIDPKVEGSKYVTGYNIVPGARQEVHHVILYLVERAVAEAEDARSPEPGWECFGGAGVDVVGVLGAWAPGGDSVTFPGGTGISLSAGQVIAMQIHYNTRDGAPVPDATSAQLMLADRPVNRAFLIPVVADRFAIPPKTMGYTHKEHFPNELGLDANLWGVMPHMHTKGRRITMRTDDTCLVDIPKWDFHWQRAYFRTRAAAIPQSGGLSIECTWDNPDDQIVRWGERTSDEMCFAFIYTTLK